MAINFPNDPATNPGNGGQWTDPGGSGTWEVELINGEAVWTLVSNDAGGGGGGSGATSLNELADVTLSNPTDTNVLQYNSSTGQWINAPAPAAGNVNLNDLGDVNTTGGTEGDVLVKQSNGNWEAQTPANNGGIGEAPEDGTPYVRQDASWISMPDNGGGATLNIDEAPADDQAYTRKNNAWVPGVESTTGSTAQIEGDNNIDTGTTTRAVATGQVLTYDGTKFAPAALPADNVGIGEAPNDGKQYGRQSEGWTEITASGGGGGGIEEAPEDGTLYARSDASWKALSGTTLSNGKLSTSSEEQVVPFEAVSEATAAGFTQVTLNSDADDGNTAVQLPTRFNNTSWFEVRDPNSPPNSNQQIWVSGNGFAAFMDEVEASKPYEDASYPGIFGGYEGSTMDVALLLFGFVCSDLVMDMICTKEVDDWFVIRIQWKDDYNNIMTAPLQATENEDYPYTNYPAARKASPKAKAKPKTAASSLITTELWLDTSGGFKMKYGSTPGLFSLVEDSQSQGYSRSTNGVFKQRVPVTEVMGSAIAFNVLPTSPLIYSPADTLDGTQNVADALDWYISYVPASVPFLTDAPADGTIYGRKDGSWVEAAGAGSGGGAVSTGTKSYRDNAFNQIGWGLNLAYPFGQWRQTKNQGADSAGYLNSSPIPRPPNLTEAFYFNLRGIPGPPEIDYDAQSGQLGIEANAGREILTINKYDLNENQFFNSFVTTGPDLLLNTDGFWYYENTLDARNQTVYLAVTVSWCKYTPEEEQQWTAVSVDTYIPLDITETPPNSSESVKKFFIDNQFYGTGENDCKTWYDFVGNGFTADDYNNVHVNNYFLANPGPDSNNEYPWVRPVAFIIKARPRDTALLDAPDDKGAAGGGYSYRNNALPDVEKTKGEDSLNNRRKAYSNSRDIGNGGGTYYYYLNTGSSYNTGLPNYRATNGMIPVYRNDLVLDLNIGRGKGGQSLSGGGAPARKFEGTTYEEYQEYKKQVFEDRITDARKRLADNVDVIRAKKSERILQSIDVGKKRAEGGWLIPSYDSDTDDPRFIWDFCVQGNNPGDSSSGILTYDRLGLWDLYGFSPFMSNTTPPPNDTLQWDDVNKEWTYASEIFFRSYGKKAKDNPAIGKVMEIIDAVNSDPELKAALKAALAD